MQRPPTGRRFSRRALLGGALFGAVGVPITAGLAGCAPPSLTEADLRIPSPSHPVRWPISTAHPPIEPGLRPEPGSTLRLYNYASYLGPKVMKDFEAEFGVTISLSTFNDDDEALTKIA